MIFYTSDLHLGHARLVECGFRKFTDSEMMDDFIINMINLRCQKEDKLYILGDLSMSHHYEDIAYWLKQIKCQIFVIQGNHYSRKVLDRLKEENIICNWYPWKIIEDENYIIEGRPFVVALHHHPVIDYHSSRRADCCFHGHSHGLNPRRFSDLHDVGVDCCRFMPMTAKEILGIDDVSKEVMDEVEKFNKSTGLNL